MSAFLDDLARSLAQPIPRRRALGLLGRALLAAALPAALRPRPARADSCSGCSNPALQHCRNGDAQICSFVCCPADQLCCNDAQRGVICCNPACGYTCGKVMVGGEEYPSCVPKPGISVCSGFAGVAAFCCNLGESCCRDQCCPALYECCADPFTGLTTCCPPTQTCQNGKCTCKDGKRRCRNRRKKCCKGETCCGKKLCCSTGETCCGKTRCCAADQTCCGGLLCCAAGEVCNTDTDVPECLPSSPLTA